MSHPAADPVELGAMRLAIELAALEHPHPNPRVGAVVIDRAGAIVGEGAHVRPGTAHAEQLALDRAGAAARGGTVVVTLEPCSHHGLTPPCADALIEAGVRRVVGALEDPDERVAGSGYERLVAAGIEVVTGVCAQEAAALDPGYLIHRRLGRPRVVVVWVATLDGQTAALDDQPATELLSTAATEDLRELRGEADVAVVGSGFVRSIHPPLGGDGTDRPRVAVISGRRYPAVDLTTFPFRPIVIAGTANTFEVGRGDVSPVVLPTEDGLRVDLEAALRHLGDQGLLDAHVEGGQALISAFERQGLVDEYRLYLVGRLAGGTGRSAFDGSLTRMGEARPVEITDVRQIGGDLRIDARALET